MIRCLRKSLILLAVLFIVATSPVYAYADYSICTSYYNNGCLEWVYCNHYYDDGAWKGSVSIEYQC
jgi:hypothetical protein